MSHWRRKAALPLSLIAAGALLACAVPAWSAVQRIVTLSPHGAALVAAAGGGRLLVGVAAYTSQTADIPALPVIADANAIDREQLLAVKPDLAVAWEGGNREADLDWLAAHGITLYRSNPRSLEDIPREIRELGALMGTAPTAQHRARELEAVIESIDARYAEAAPIDIFFQIWPRPRMTLGGRALASRALGRCGLRNVLGRVQREAFTLERETLLAIAPEIELIPDDLGAGAPPLSGAAHRLVFPANDLYRPGPGLIAATATLCAAARAEPGPVHGR